MLAPRLIDALPPCASANPPGRVIGRLEAAVALPTRLCGAQPALRPLVARPLDALAAAVAGETGLRDALQRAAGPLDCAPGGHGSDEPGPGRRSAGATRILTAVQDPARVARARQTTAAGGAAVARPAAPPSAAATAGGRTDVGMAATPPAPARGANATPARGAGEAAAGQRPAVRLERYAAARAGGTRAAATVVLPAPSPSPSPSPARSGVAGAPRAAHPRRAAGADRPAAARPEHPGLAAAPVTDAPRATRRAARRPQPSASRTPQTPAVPGAPGTQTPWSSRRGDETLAFEAAPVEIPSPPPPGPGLAALTRWWQDTHEDLAATPPPVRPPEPATGAAVAPGDPQDLADAVGRLFVAEARRYGIEVDAS